jgi:putative ABC transport system permease protein
MKIPLTYNLRSVRQRPVSTALTALGIGLVVAVFIAMLALANGFAAALTRTGSEQNVLVLRKGADSEMSSGLDRDAVSALTGTPHIARGADGRTLASPERARTRSASASAWSDASPTPGSDRRCSSPGGRGP